MHHVSVRRRMAMFAALGAAVAVMGCEDKRVKELHVGIMRDSVMTVIAQGLRPGTPPDSFPNVYMRDQYLINGKPLEVLYFTPNDEKQGKDSVLTKKLTPLVFVNYKLIGKGWGFWDSVSKADNIPVRKR